MSNLNKWLRCVLVSIMLLGSISSAGVAYANNGEQTKT